MPARPKICRACKQKKLWLAMRHDSIVSNSAIKHTFNALPNVTLKEYPDSQHEILMETDATRSTFLNDFYHLIQRTIIDKPETLRPF